MAIYLIRWNMLLSCFRTQINDRRCLRLISLIQRALTHNPICGFWWKTGNLVFMTPKHNLHHNLEHSVFWQPTFCFLDTCWKKEKTYSAEEWPPASSSSPSSSLTVSIPSSSYSVRQSDSSAERKDLEELLQREFIVLVTLCWQHLSNISDISDCIPVKDARWKMWPFIYYIH